MTIEVNEKLDKEINKRTEKTSPNIQFFPLSIKGLFKCMALTKFVAMDANHKLTKRNKSVINTTNIK